MRQKLRKFQEVLGIFYLPLLLFLTFIALLAIGYSSVKPTTYTVELSQVAKETIRAPRTLEDKTQTEKNQQIVAVLHLQELLPAFVQDRVSAYLVLFVVPHSGVAIVQAGVCHCKVLLFGQ